MSSELLARLTERMKARQWWRSEVNPVGKPVKFAKVSAGSGVDELVAVG